MAEKEINMEEQIELSEYPNIYWKKFFDQFVEVNTLDIGKWRNAHIIGYFCKKYKEYYKIKYTFKFNDVPTKSYEVYQIKKVASMLSSDPMILKEYIDWVFDNKVINRKKRITVIGYLAATEMINEFKFDILMPRLENTQQIDRSTKLLPEYLEVCVNENINVSTYGDLAFIMGMIDQDIMQDTKYINLFNKLIAIGLDLNTLKRIR